jgi:putative PIN family toxin of toxin-antitoxin system
MAQLSKMNMRRQLVTERLMLRAVFDTNVIIAALRSKNPNSPTVELLQRWRRGEFTLIYCDDLQAEYREKFIDRNIDLPIRVTFLNSLFEFGECIQLSSDQIQPRVPVDPDDDVVIACAIAGQATHLVT